MDLTPRASLAWLCAVGAALCSAALPALGLVGGIDRSPGTFVGFAMLVACGMNFAGAWFAGGFAVASRSLAWLFLARRHRAYIAIGGFGSLNFLVVGLALASVSGAVVGVLQDLWPLTMLVMLWIIPPFRAVRPPGAVGPMFWLALVVSAAGAALVVSAQFGGVAWADFAFWGVCLAIVAAIIVSLQFLCNMTLVRELSAHLAGRRVLGGWRRELLAQSLATVPTRLVAAILCLVYAAAVSESFAPAQLPWALAMAAGFVFSGYCHRLALRLAPDLRVVVVHYLSPVMTVGWLAGAGVAGIPLDTPSLWVGIGLIVAANAVAVPRRR